MLLSKDASTVHDLVGLPKWLQEMWNKVDVGYRGSLNLDEVTVLMKKLNILLTKNQIKSAFKNSNISKTESITFDEFERLYRNLKFRPEISNLFSQISTNGMTIAFEEFREFIVNVQKQEWEEQRTEEIYKKFVNATGNMDFDHFTSFLLSSRNAVFKKDYRERHQNMNYPICDYYINSSHNTYLLGDQFASESSVEGCRCLEIDCWDGPNGQPVIYHGGTLTSKLSFKDAIETIMKYAFVVTDTPLVLSLEIRCSWEQQNVVAEILEAKLGDFLVKTTSHSLNPGQLSSANLGQLPSTNPGQLPSPNQLKNKILIKGKCLSLLGDDISDDDLNSEGGSSPTSPASIYRKLSYSMTITTTPTQDIPPEKGIRRSKSKVAGSTSKALTSLIVYLRGKPAKHIESLTNILLKFDQVFSFTENKALGLMQKQPEEYLKLTRNNVIRVYPSILRLTSSNYDPIPHWLVGTQMAALNFQTFGSLWLTVDTAMEINRALFATNGDCGYVLKPERLRSVNYPILISKKLTVIVLSAQQLVRSKEKAASSTKSAVSIEIIGDPKDSQKQKSQTVKSNGFNPIFSKEFSFNITHHDLCFLRFNVEDVDGLTTDSFGSYRHIPLNNKQGERIGFSTLFVKISILDVE
ncbi:hypothetical protein HDV01_001361 [Terramyces sp. JEL0728]|nr:hypothetical protein HDV01_001361 [Terramyces sp. JEL0728]